ncbi:MAG: ABC transporter permease [Alphaproteobacteria bacterium]|nr:ABC transporter permease [Alphaproteobacteria bacterium]
MDTTGTDERLNLTPATRAWRRGHSAFAACVYFFLLMPSLIVVPMSFGDKREIMFPPGNFTLNLYREYFFASTWMATTMQSLKIAILSAAISLVAGFFAAYALVRYEFPGKRLLNLALLSPALVPVIIVALGTYLYFSTIGITGTTAALVVAHSVHTVPFVIVTLMAGLRHVDPNLERAAELMGASRMTVIRRVTLPLLRPALMAGAMFAFLISFDEVVISWFVSSPSTQTLPVKMYSSIQWEVSPVLAAVSTLLTLLSLFICLVSAAMQKPS